MALESGAAAACAGTVFQCTHNVVLFGSSLQGGRKPSTPRSKLIVSSGKPKHALGASPRLGSPHSETASSAQSPHATPSTAAEGHPSQEAAPGSTPRSPVHKDALPASPLVAPEPPHSQQSAPLPDPASSSGPEPSTQSLSGLSDGTPQVLEGRLPESDGPAKRSGAASSSYAASADGAEGSPKGPVLRLGSTGALKDGIQSAPGTPTGLGQDPGGVARRSNLGEPSRELSRAGSASETVTELLPVAAPPPSEPEPVPEPAHPASSGASAASEDGGADLGEGPEGGAGDSSPRELPIANGGESAEMVDTGLGLSAGEEGPGAAAASESGDGEELAEPAAEPVAEAVNRVLEGAERSDLQALVEELQGALQAREVQLERKAQEVASMQEVTQQLMVTPPPQYVTTTYRILAVIPWSPFLEFGRLFW